MKIFLFYFEMAIKITGSAQNYRVGRISGNTPIFVGFMFSLHYMIILVIFPILVSRAGLWFPGHCLPLSLVMRKPAFCICENKGADQLRSNCAADQRLCFRYMDSTIILLSKSEISSL